MKYYEVRMDKDNTKVWLYNNGFSNNPEGNIIYDGDFPLLKSFKMIDKGLYVPEFRGMCDSITKDNLTRAGFFNDWYNTRLDWVVNDSDHRKDVRVIDENLYNKLLKGSKRFNIVKECEHLESVHPYSLDTTYIKATTAIHKMGDISRPDGDYAWVNEADDNNYYGQWLSGLGYIDVKFPKATSTVVTKEEARNE